MIPAWAVAFAKSKSARVVAAALVVLTSLWLARCDGARHQSAKDRQDAADAQAKTSETAAKHDAQIGDSVKAVLADSIRGLTVAKAKADSSAAHALAHIGTITVIHRPTSAPTETPVAGTDTQPEPDTTKYATIQRQGDAQLYTVPQFVVDLGAELRKAITAKSDEASKAERNLAIAAKASAADSATMRDLRDALAKRTTAENIAKSNAGQSCRIAFVLPCVPRKIVFVGGLILGAAAGYEVARK